MVPLVWSLVSLVFAGSVQAVLPDGRLHGNMMRTPVVPRISHEGLEGPVVGVDGTELPPYDQTYYFDQLIDHNNPSLGTFKQRYWHTWENYKAGGPIILSTPGEGNADGYWTYLTNRTVNGLIAQQQGGATVVIEHRFYGLSNPYPDLTVKSLRFHTLQQAVDDLVYFAENAVLPMPGGNAVTPATNPWILIGGSYSGALTSWTMVNKPGVFFAGYSSSGVVQAINNFWAYFEPIRQNMPKNCSADVTRVIEYVDATFTGHNKTAIAQLKDKFGMGNVSHVDDVAGALRNNLWDWQSLQPTSGPNTAFRRFCDALEVNDQGVSASASGWGLQHALDAWSSYWKNTYLSNLCGGTSNLEACLGTYDPTQQFYTNTDIDNASRSWMWIVCNEVGYFQEGAPRNQPTLVSRLIQPAYDERQCQYMFPEAFKVAPVPRDFATNIKYKGWNVRLNRLFFANGIRDPWRDATVSADGLHVQSTPQQPIGLGDGFHCSDLSTKTGAADASIGAVQTKALASMKTWLATQWKAPGSHYKPYTRKWARDTDAEKRDETEPTVVVLPEAKPINAWFRGAGDM